MANDNGPEQMEGKFPWERKPEYCGPGGAGPGLDHSNPIRDAIKRAFGKAWGAMGGGKPEGPTNGGGGGVRG
jgi:hypothetical protein